jgi:hypothetical protein
MPTCKEQDMTSATIDQRATGVAVRATGLWAWAGLLATVGGIGGVAYFDTERSMANQDVRLRLCAAFGMAGVAGLLVFVSGLRGYLDAQTPAGSLVGAVAQFGGQLAATTLFTTYLLKIVASEYTERITGSADVVVRNGLDELTT